MVDRRDEPPYPLAFEPIYKTKVWGGRNLERLGRVLPGGADTRIGESWELADLSETSASGGGGGAERSVIASGPLAGLTLHAAWQRLGSRLFPRSRDGEPQDFPLLVKWLDARENLSLQVHPSPDYVRGHPEASLKSEAWYVVDAEPGAVIYKGVRAGVRPADFRRALDVRDAAVLRSLLIEIPVRAGDCHYLPSGTCHALGAGTLVAEVQNPSDTTFRVFDWGRTDRELHVEQAMACIHFGPCDASRFEPRGRSERDGARVIDLVHCPEFHLARIELDRGRRLALPSNRPAVWMVLEGEGVIDCTDAAPTAMRRGGTFLLPAGLTGAIASASSDCAWLEVTIHSCKA